VTPDHRHQATGAAVFTRNAFAAAPVQLCRREVDLGSLAAVVMNSGNANACTGRPGLEAARLMQQAAAVAAGLPRERVAVASTGIIGHQLDRGLVQTGIEAAGRSLSAVGGPAFAESILTTDRFPKTAAFEVATRDGLVRLAGCAKGAGMIAPGMATMLCAVTTDALLDPETARSLLHSEVEHTFNRVSVDGQMSTNDCVFFLASGASGISLSTQGRAQLSAALGSLLLRLALMMVADGEGATKVMRLRLTGAPSDEAARLAARAVADSPLVKTAMYGGDPNWGRILSSAGAALADHGLNETVLEMGGLRLVERATPLSLEPDEEARLRQVMDGPEIDILLDLKAGSSQETVYFSDLGYEYVTINAEYHT
jgi:glutamate N-acetyltransferase / amino-acid N-acetyltransferase